jgi:hypothetical protein
LKVPGSPSSALQTMTLSGLAASRQKRHLSAVVKPAPPRPRSPARSISASTAGPPWPKQRRKARVARFQVRKQQSRPVHVVRYREQGLRPVRSGRSASTSAAISRMRPASSRVSASPFTSAAGPWSHMPVQEVTSTVTRPSARGSPGRTPSASQSSVISAALPSMRSVMLSLIRISKRPRGVRCRKA